MLKIVLVLALLLSPGCWAKPTAADLCREGRALMRRGRVNEGMDKYVAALKLDSGYAPAHAGLGQHLARCGQQSNAVGEEKQRRQFFEIALKHLDRAVKAEPKDAQSLFWRGECFYEQKAYAKALRDYDRSIAIKSEWPVHMARAMCHSRLGRDDKAVSDYSVVWKQTKDPMCLYNRGNCYRRMNKLKLAETDYQTVVRLGKEKQTVEWARESLKEMQDEVRASDYRHPVTGLKVPGSFSYHAEFYRCRGAAPLAGGSPGEMKISHNGAGGAITTYIYAKREAFDEEWSGAKLAIENGPLGKGTLLKESRLTLAGFEQARQAAYQLPDAESLVALLSFRGHHIKVRITATEGDVSGLARHFLSRMKTR